MQILWLICFMFLVHAVSYFLIYKIIAFATLKVRQIPTWWISWLASLLQFLPFWLCPYNTFLDSVCDRISRILRLCGMQFCPCSCKDGAMWDCGMVGVLSESGSILANMSHVDVHVVCSFCTFIHFHLCSQCSTMIQ